MLSQQPFSKCERHLKQYPVKLTDLRELGFCLRNINKYRLLVIDLVHECSPDFLSCPFQNKSKMDFDFAEVSLGSTAVTGGKPRYFVGRIDRMERVRKSN